MEVKVLYEDTDLLVVEKPSGMTVNKSDTTKAQVTLQDWVEGRGQRAEGKEQTEVDVDTQGSIDNPEVFYNRAGIAHRLDKETSGILLIGKTPYAFFNLLKQFRERTVHKSYSALVHGKIAPPTGVVSAPVGRQEWNRKRFGVVAGGREATTRYETVRYYKDGNALYSLLRLYPETGRTHQIRVHVKYINHPIVSDELYGGRKTARSDRKNLQRLFLHASEISFLHPVTGKTVHFESPLADDLQAFIDNNLMPVEDDRELG